MFFHPKWYGVYNGYVELLMGGFDRKESEADKDLHR